MATTTPRKPTIAVTDASAEADARVGGEDLEEYIDTRSLQSEIENAAQQNRAEGRPFRRYQKVVIERAGVRNTHQHRQLASGCCGAVARLSAVPDDEIKVRDPWGQETTEYELQIRAIAESACSTIPGEQVLIVTAMKLARAALELRKDDPDGKKHIAWVNDIREDEAGLLDD